MTARNNRLTQLGRPCHSSPMTADLIGTHEAATRLAVSVRTVHRLVAHGRLTPAAKVPGATGAYLFHPDHVAALAATLRAAA